MPGLTVKRFSADNDIPNKCKLLAQIIIDNHIYAQTPPVEGMDGKNDLWNLNIKCQIPASVSVFSVAILREWPINVTRLLGLVQMERDNILIDAENGKGISLPLVDMNGYDPILDVTAKFVEPSQAIQQSSLYPMIFSESFHTYVQKSLGTNPQLTLNLDTLHAHLLQICETGEQINQHQISLIYENLLFLNDYQELKAIVLNVLGDICSQKYETSKDINDLNQSISIYEDAVQLGQGNPDNLTYQTNLAQNLGSRFEQLSDLSDLSRAIQLLDDVLLLTPDDDPDKHTHLSNLGNLLSWQFEHTGNLADLERSIMVIENVILLTPNDDSDRCTHFNNLGISLSCQYEHLGVLADIERSIQVFEEAVALTPDDHPYKSDHLVNLAHSIQLRFEQLGDVGDLNRAIQITNDAFLMTLVGHPHKSLCLSNLGSLLMHRFQRLGDIEDINKSIQVGEEAVSLTSDGHAEKLKRLTNLGALLVCRFERLGNLDDLNRSIQVIEDSIHIAPDEHPEKPGCLNMLGVSLLHRFERFQDPADITRSIQVKKEAVHLTPDGHPDKAAWLSNLGTSLLECFKRFGNLSDLSMCIKVIEEAILLTPDGHPQIPKYLHSLGASLLIRFDRMGNSADLDRSVQVIEEAVLLTPNGHTEKPRYLISLGKVLTCRFEEVGNLADLNRSIQLIEESIILTPKDHTRKPQLLSSLGSSFMRRFEHLGDLADLNRSVQLQEDAVLAIPNGHPDRPAYLNSLGNSLLRHFDRVQNLASINRSAQAHEDAVLGTADGHPDKPMYLGNLGNSLMYRSKQLKSLVDIDQSITVIEDAISLTPHDHPERPRYLTNLGASLMQRFEQVGELNDLDRSIEVSEAAVKLISDHHRDNVTCLHNLAQMFETRFKKTGAQADLQAAISSYSHVAQAPVGPVSLRFKAASNWLQIATIHSPDQRMVACEIGMSLIPQLAWLGSNIHDRHHRIMKAGRFTRDAAAIAMEAKKYDMAAEWLEQGRSVIWTQLLQLRSPIDELKHVNPQLADRLAFVSTLLDGSTSLHNMDPDQPPVESTVKLDYHQYALERENLLKEIRELPEFERFLLPKNISMLLSAAKGGAVVMVNVSELRCDALLLIPGHNHIIHIRLGELAFKEVVAWHDGLQLIINNGTFTIPDSESHGFRLKAIRRPDYGRALNREEGLAYILGKLWHYVVNPILRSIESRSDIHRIWWCPTGPLAFLPIHAAGVYPSGPKLSDFVISSYTPTLNTLLDRSPTLPSAQRLLTVALPQQSSPRLPGTEKEVEIVEKHAQNFCIRRLFESDATPKSVSEAMKEFSWVHFACHGMQDISNPTRSCLSLSNHSELTLAEIIRLRLQNADLAFLSACQTAAGDKDLEEEVVHLAAGMLLAGYKGVIATMWNIDDDFAVRVADETYSRIFKEYGGNCTHASEALHYALKKLSNEKDGNGKSKFLLFSWVPFIHMGI